MEDLPGYDAWLSGYQQYPIEAYCTKRDCPNADGVTVSYTREYGQGWIEPEDCPICNSELSLDPNDNDDEDEEKS